MTPDEIELANVERQIGTTKGQIANGRLQISEMQGNVKAWGTRLERLEERKLLLFNKVNPGEAISKPRYPRKRR